MKTNLTSEEFRILPFAFAIWQRYDNAPELIQYEILEGLAKDLAEYSVIKDKELRVHAIASRMKGWIDDAIMYGKLHKMRNK